MTSDQLLEELGTLLGRCVKVIRELEVENAELKAGRAALAEQEEAEPVAWIRAVKPFDITRIRRKTGKTWKPLYTAPPRREWVSLTDEEIFDLYFDGFSLSELKEYARAIEAELKERNHG